VLKARKHQSSWISSSAALALTKICAPKCLHFQDGAVTDQEKRCIQVCIDKMYGSQLATLNLMREFEKTQS
jgi:hypothetical protein